MHAAVEALDVAILHRLNRSDLMPSHPDLPATRQHSISGELGAIIAYDHPGLAPLGDQPGQLAHDAVSGDLGSRHFCQPLFGQIIDHDEHPAPFARSHLAENEVDATALARKC